MGHSREGSLTFLLSQFPSVVVTGHVLRELKQVSAGGGCPSRPWRARAKSDLQLGRPEAPAGLPPTCQGALALSGVLRRLQQVEDKILQKRAENLANREFHKKNIKEKAAHLASMFGHGDFPQVNTGLSEPPGTQMLHIWQSGHESISGASFPPPSSFSGRRGY